MLTFILQKEKSLELLLEVKKLMWLVCAMCFVFALLSLKQNRKIISPFTLFFGLWWFITGLYALRILELFDIKDSTLSVILIGLFCFAAGSFLAQNTSFCVNIRNAHFVPDNILTPSHRYYIFLSITIILLSVSALNGLTAVLSGATLHDIRYLLRDDVLSDDSGVLSVMFLYFASPMSILIMHYNSVRILYKTNFKEAIITNVFILILNELTVGGRLMIIYFGIDMLLILFMWRREKRTEVNLDLREIKRNKRRKKIITAIGIVVIIAVCVITVNGGSKIWRTVYYYSCGCLPHLDNKIGVFDGNYTYGFTSFDGFIRPFAVVLRTAGITNGLPAIVEQAEKNLLLVEQACKISSDGYYNGFITPFYSFYVDGGIGLVALFSFSWGWIVMRNYKKVSKFGTSKNTFYYFLLMQTVAISMLRFLFNDYKYALAYLYFILIFACFRKKKETV